MLERPTKRGGSLKPALGSGGFKEELLVGGVGGELPSLSLTTGQLTLIYHSKRCVLLNVIVPKMRNSICKKGVTQMPHSAPAFHSAQWLLLSVVSIGRSSSSNHLQGEALG